MIHCIPRKALAWHTAVLAKTGAGKSYAVRGDIVEPLLDTDERVCIVDPTDAWHGLRSSATGKSAGYPVVIFGGEHGDLPLQASHGEAIAEVVGTSSTSCILSTKHLSIRDRTKFFTDFAEGIMRKNRGPLHLIIDEAHRFAPKGQKMSPQSGEMLAAANELVSAGRSAGLRVTLITQRPAKLHNDSLTQVETLVAMRMNHKRDKEAVIEWVEDNADKEQAKEILTSLAKLETGEGWVWCPQLDYLKRVKFPRIKTFDSSAAPETGRRGRRQVLAPIDRDAIAERLKTVGVDAAANDPVALRKRIAELERQARTQTAAANPAIDAEAREAIRRDAAIIKALQAAIVSARRTFSMLREWQDKAAIAAANLMSATEANFDKATENTAPAAAYVSIHPQKSAAPATRRTGTAPIPPRSHRQIDGRAAVAGDVGTGGKRRILTALAQYPDGLSSRKLSILIDISQKGGTWRTYMTEMRGNGWVHGGRDLLRITEAGLTALGDWEPLPTGEALVDYWRARLGDSGKRKIFNAIVSAYPKAISQEEVSDITGISLSGGTWRTYMAELRGLEIIEGRGDLRASEDLFS